MAEVVCWCCENYNSLNRLMIINGAFVDGYCLRYNKPCLSESNVCEEFVMRIGLFTKRTIPDYCKNYKEKKN